MADTLSSQIKASIDWLRQETLDLGNVSDQNALEFDETLEDGTSADQADVIWHDTRSIASGANDDLDLTALTQTIFGTAVTITFAKVSAILIVNNSTTAGEELVVDSSVAAAWKGWCNGSATSKLEIGPDSAAMVSSKKDSWAVTATTADILRISNPASGSAISYSIVIIGRSA